MFHAYNPDTLEEVEFEENPYCFRTTVNDKRYLIERNLESGEHGRSVSTIRITQESATIESWNQQ